MITPSFKISQDEGNLFVVVRAPMAKVTDTSIAVDGETFCFYSKPYYLRLNLSGRLAPQDGSERIEWDAEKNEFRISLLKETEGEHFTDLEMLTKLLTKPRNDRNKLNPGIEVLDSVPVEDSEEFDWYIDQNEWTEDDQKAILGEKYGFANRYSGVLSRMEDELGDLLELKRPETVTNAERVEMRIKKDKEKFDQDHYWADLYDQKDIVEELIRCKFDWDPSTTTESDSSGFSEEEIFRMKNLPKREYLLTRKEKFHLLLGLVDILFAYAYDMRTTEGEHNCESGWTISKLSSTLSWLQVFSTLPETLVACVQRALVYPLYRNWSLSMKVIDDVTNILSKGKVFVVKRLLEIHRIFNEAGDLQYIHNDLYITDYCVWVQTVKEKTFLSLAEAIKRVEMTKDLIQFDLEVIERAAEMAIDEHPIS